MRFESLISFLLIFLFLGKLFMIDSSLINSFSQGSITVVKSTCPNKKLSTGRGFDLQFEQTADVQNSVIKLSSFCNPHFNFNFFSWNFIPSEEINTNTTSFTSDLSYRYLDSHSPPPRQV